MIVFDVSVNLYESQDFIQYYSKVKGLCTNCDEKKRTHFQDEEHKGTTCLLNNFY